MDVLTPAIEAALDALETESEATRAILEMAHEYMIETDNTFDQFGGLVLVGLERAGAISEVAAQGT